MNDINYLVEQFNKAIKSDNALSAQVIWTRLVNMGYKLEE